MDDYSKAVQDVSRLHDLFFKVISPLLQKIPEDSPTRPFYPYESVLLRNCLESLVPFRFTLPESLLKVQFQGGFDGIYSIQLLNTVNRVMIDSFITLLYLDQDKDNAQIKQAKKDLFNYHEYSFRANGAKKIDSKHPMRQSIINETKRLKDSILNPSYCDHPIKTAKKPEEWLNKRHLLFQEKEIIQRAGFCWQAFKMISDACSQYIHSLPFSFKQMMDSDLEERSRELAEMALQNTIRLLSVLIYHCETIGLHLEYRPIDWDAINYEVSALKHCLTKCQRSGVVTACPQQCTAWKDRVEKKPNSR
jgi:hypothetical protein